MFKNINWNGKLYASLLPGACQTGVADSLVLNVVSAPQGPVFAPDTSLCKGNSIVLHAGPAFSSYLWQDGSKDSTYTVTVAGAYSVAVTDFCGNNYQASTQVIPANFSFTLGPDLSKCNNDTVELRATGGFTNYQWTAAGFNAAGPADSVVLVDPGQNTGYAVTAEKWAGCTVQATVEVLVKPAPLVDLGADTAICFGKDLLLNAATAGINATYLWQDGSTGPELYRCTGAGNYIATVTLDGCSSTDTIAVSLYRTTRIHARSRYHTLQGAGIRPGAHHIVCRYLPMAGWQQQKLLHGQGYRVVHAVGQQ